MKILLDNTITSTSEFTAPLICVEQMFQTHIICFCTAALAKGEAAYFFLGKVFKAALEKSNLIFPGGVREWEH